MIPFTSLKIATWNVNGIRARQAQVQEWIERERPDVVCLQEIKAASDQVPTALCEMEGYWCYWHGGKGYSGVALHVNKAFAPERPAFSHPSFDYENRIVAVTVGGLTVGSVYVPNGGKDFPAKMRFLHAMDQYAREFSAAARRSFCAATSTSPEPIVTSIPKSASRERSASFLRSGPCSSRSSTKTAWSTSGARS